MAMIDLISLENESFKSYAFWTACLTVKMLAMSLITAFRRYRTKTYANPEDLPSKKLLVKFNNDYVERSRRGHLNDLENILPHTIVGFVYLMTNPPVLAAVNLFRVFGIARFVHTFVYVVKPMPQPARAISFFVSWLCTFYMCLKVIAFFGGAVPK